MDASGIREYLIDLTNPIRQESVALLLIEVVVKWLIVYEKELKGRGEIYLLHVQSSEHSKNETIHF